MRKVILALALIFTLLPVAQAFAADDTCQGDPFCEQPLAF